VRGIGWLVRALAGANLCGRPLTARGSHRSHRSHPARAFCRSDASRDLFPIEQAPAGAPFRARSLRGTNQPSRRPPQPPTPAFCRSDASRDLSDPATARDRAAPTTRETGVQARPEAPGPAPRRGRAPARAPPARRPPAPRGSRGSPVGTTSHAPAHGGASTNVTVVVGRHPPRRNGSPLPPLRAGRFRNRARRSRTRRMAPGHQAGPTVGEPLGGAARAAARHLLIT
jgi:hypothetical protein